MPELLAIADEVVKLRAVCMRCKDPSDGYPTAAPDRWKAGAIRQSRDSGRRIGELRGALPELSRGSGPSRSGRHYSRHVGWLTHPVIISSRPETR